MAEATTADLLKAQEETTKKIAFVGNVLNKNIVPASQQKERDAEDNMFKQKLLEGMLSLKDSLKNMAKRTLQVAGFPIAIIMGAIAFIIAFFTQIGKELAKLKKILPVIKGIGKIISGVFGAIRSGLVLAKEAVVAKFVTALAAFKETKVFKSLGTVFTWLGSFVSRAKWFVIGKLSKALAIFKEGPMVKAISGAFKTIGGFFGRAIGVGKGITGGIVGAVKSAMAAFKNNVIFKSIANIGKTLAGAFSGVLNMVGGAAKAASMPGGAGAKAGKGIVGAITKVTKSIGGMVSTIGKFTGLSKIVTFAKGFGTTLGKLLWPITVIIGIFDFIKGFRKDKGWEGEDATIFTKIGMGISEALQGIIGLPLDMIKNVVAWILGKFGIGKTIDPETGQEVEAGWMTAMKEFSFSDLIDKLIGGLWSGMQAVIDWVGKLFSDPVATLKEAGKTVLSAFTNFGTWLWDNSIGKAIGWVKDLLGIEDKEKPAGGGGEAKEVESKGWLSWIMDTILPKGLVDFIKAPIATILGWVGLGGDTTTDGDTKPKELEGAEGKPEGGWFSAILGKIFTPTLLLFLLGPVGWILGFLGFIVKAAGATGDTGSTGDKDLDAAKGKGEKNMFAKFLEAILPAGLIAFVTDPIDWILKFIGWKDAEGKTTGAGTEAGLILKEGSFKDKANLFKSVVWSILPDGLRKFLEIGPVNWVLQKIGWQTAEGDPTKAGEAAGQVIATGSFKEKAGLLGRVIWSVLPDGLKKFLELGPVNWFLQKIGWQSAEGKATEAGKVGGQIIATGTFKEKAGLLGRVIWSVLPDGLKNFLEIGPVNWILQKIGWQSAEGKGTEKGAAGVETLKHGTFSDKAKMFTDIIWSILPTGLKDFFDKGPIAWIKEKIFGPSKTKPTDSSADSFFANWKLPTWDSFKELLPQWLSDPVGWVTGLFKKGEEVGQEEKFRIEAQEREKGIVKHGQTLKGAQEAGLYNKWGVGFDSDINREELTRAVEIKQVDPEMLQAILDDKDLSEQDTAFMKELLEKATNPGSLFVHDINVEKSIKELIQPMIALAAAQNAMLASYGGGSGGGGTTVNNVTVSPSTSNTVSSVQKSENTYGTVDPYTSAAGAYG